MTAFNSIIYGAIVCILAVTVGNACRGEAFNTLEVASSVTMLLSLVVLYKLASRRPKTARKAKPPAVFRPKNP